MGAAERRGKFQTHPLLSGLWEEGTWSIMRAKKGEVEGRSFAASPFKKHFVPFGSISDLLETWVMEWSKEMWVGGSLYVI